MKTPVSDNQTTKLLWTGGWDSTFRLLQLLLLERRAVVPYYLIDADRASTGAEMKAMKDIKTRLFRECPGTRGLLHRVEYMEVGDIEPDSEITAAFRAVVEKGHLGSQYDWLARFCRQQGLGDIELCIHRDDKAHRVLESFVLERCVEGRTTYTLDISRAPPQECSLFRYFRFPLFHVSKLEMAAAARTQDWSRFLNMTWFCHHPTARHKPCGTCQPCLYTIEEGLGWRIPWSRRVAAKLQRALFKPLRRTRKALGRGLTRRLRASRAS